MSNASSQHLPAHATSRYPMLQIANFISQRHHEFYSGYVFSFEPQTVKRNRPVKQSFPYSHYRSSEYVQKHNGLYPCVLGAGEKYDERIDFLKKEGDLDGVSLNPESLRGFKEFTYRYIPTKSCGLVLYDNGNLRAVWNSDGESFVGLQFLNRELIEYILFSQTAPSLPVSRSYGQAAIDSVMSQIEALELEWMLYEQ